MVTAQVQYTMYELLVQNVQSIHINSDFQKFSAI